MGKKGTFLEPTENREIAVIQYFKSRINGLWVPMQATVESNKRANLGYIFDFDERKDGDLFYCEVGNLHNIYDLHISSLPNQREIIYKVWSKQPMRFILWTEGENRIEIPYKQLHKYGYEYIISPLESEVEKAKGNLVCNPFDMGYGVSNTAWCEECDDWYSDWGYCDHILARFRRENGYDEDDD